MPCSSTILDWNAFDPAKREAAIIKCIKAREIIDSRGNPTLEVTVTTEAGLSSDACVPSGASTGIHEAHELRDGDKGRYCAKGVLAAMKAVNTEINDKLKGKCAKNQEEIDKAMIDLDGTPNKKRLGANAILGVSLACAKVAAFSQGLPLYRWFGKLAGNEQHMVLPIPCFNVVNGGSHAGNSLAFQEFFIIPVGAKNFPEAIRIGCECYHELKTIIKKKKGPDATMVGDEGGFAPPCTAEEGVQLILDAIKAAGHGGTCKIGLDVAASEFLVEGSNPHVYDVGKWNKDADKKDDLKMDGAKLLAFYAKMVKDHPEIITIEDPFDQDGWADWKAMTAQIGGPIQIVGDDLTVTNVKRIQDSIDQKACNALLLKVNQIGTLTESIQAVKLCKQHDWGIMCSHRSGETEDTVIADLAVGLCCGQIKTGAPCRGERTSKYNRLMQISEELGASAVYAGNTWRKPAWMGK